MYFHVPYRYANICTSMFTHSPPLIILSSTPLPVIWCCEIYCRPVKCSNKRAVPNQHMPSEGYTHTHTHTYTKHIVRQTDIKDGSTER